MGRKSKPWWKPSHRCYFSRVRGELVRLYPDYDQSVRALAILAGPPKPAVLTVRGLVETYLRAAARRVRHSTYVNLAWSLGRFVAALGDLPAADVRVSHVREWADNQDWNRSSRSTYAAHVSRAFRWAVDEELIPDYHLTRLRRPGYERRRPIAEHEAMAFRAAVVSPDLADWWDVAASCGARPGELCGLEARHLSDDFRVALVDGKTGGRTICFPAALRETLARLAERRPTGPILRGRDDQAWVRNSLGKRFRVVARTSGVDVVPYHTRGLFASRCYAAGADHETVERLLGHAPKSILARHYLTIPRDRLLAAVDAGWGRAAG